MHIDTDIVIIFLSIHTTIIGSKVDNIIRIMHSTDVPNSLFTILFQFIKKGNMSVGVYIHLISV